MTEITIDAETAAEVTHLAGNVGNAGNQPYTGVCGARGSMTTIRRQATCPICLAPAAALSFKRSGSETAVMLGDVAIGRVVRREGSDSSPRGRAYRTFHYPITAAGKQLLRCYSRAEAVEVLLHQLEARA
jgi:hypothetical protein